MSLVISILTLCILGLPGVVLLQRLTPRLTALERWVYGLPLGAVLGSLVLLVLAVLANRLSTALVVAVLAASLVLSVAGSWSTLLAWGQQRTTATRQPAPDPIATVRRLIDYVGPFALVVLALFTVRWLLLWLTMLPYRPNGLVAAQVNVWADWALHLGDVTAFVYGDNFPPQNTRFAGGPLAYHYLTSITSAALVKLGLDPTDALAQHSLFFCLLLLVGLYAFFRRLAADRDAAGLGVVLFLLGGSLGWLILAAKINSSHTFVPTIQQNAWNLADQQGAGFLWQNLFFALIESQRGYLYGLPLFLLVLTLLSLGVQEHHARYFLLAGLIAGTLPFAHTSTLVALALITPFIALLFLTTLTTWVRHWALFFGSWLLLALPQLYLQQGGQRGETSAIRWQIGWMITSTHDNWVWFWLKNLGWFCPLLLVALATRALLPSTATRFAWAAMPTFIICNLVVFRPWDWDNTKFFFYWFLFVALLVGTVLVRLWRAQPTLAVRTMIVGITLSMTLSGLLLNYQQLAGLDQNVLLTTEELQVAAQVRELTPPHATFAVSFQHNHPVPVMAGRRVLMSYKGWLFAFGLDGSTREAALRAIYALAPNAPDLIQQYGIDYVVIGPGEQQEFKPAVAAFRSRYPTIIKTANYEVFQVR